MKIEPEHYKTLHELIKSQVDRVPDFETFHRVLENSPTRARWDMLWATRLQIGDSNGSGPSGDRPFLPLYDYMNDDHLDTALRSIFKELGHDYAAAKNATGFPAFQVDDAPRYITGGFAVASLRDGETGVTSPCVVAVNGALGLSKNLFFAVKEASDRFTVENASGQSFDVQISDDGHLAINREAFEPGHAAYSVLIQTAFYDQETIDSGAEPTYSDAVSEEMTLDELTWHCSNVGISSYSDDTLYSTDPEVGGRNFFERGLHEVRLVKVQAVNGLEASAEQVHALGNAMSLSAHEQVSQSPKSAPPGPR